MVDFRKHMSPEARELLEQREARLIRERARFQQMPDVELVRVAQQYMGECSGPRDHPAGDCVYDSAMWHVVLPELLARLQRQFPEQVPQARACTCAGGEAGGHDLDCEHR